MNDVPVLNDIVFTFQAPFTSIFCTQLATILDEVVVGDNFGPNEALFKVCVNDAGCRWS